MGPLVVLHLGGDELGEVAEGLRGVKDLCALYDISMLISKPYSLLGSSLLASGARVGMATKG